MQRSTSLLYLIQQQTDCRSIKVTFILSRTRNSRGYKEAITYNKVYQLTRLALWNMKGKKKRPSYAEIWSTKAMSSIYHLEALAHELSLCEAEPPLCTVRVYSDIIVLWVVIYLRGTNTTGV